MDENLVETLNRLNTSIFVTDWVEDDDRRGERCFVCKEPRFWVQSYDEDDNEVEGEGYFDIDHNPGCPVTLAGVVANRLRQLKEGVVQPVLLHPAEACLD